MWYVTQLSYLVKYYDIKLLCQIFSYPKRKVDDLQFNNFWLIFYFLVFCFVLFHFVLFYLFFAWTVCMDCTKLLTILMCEMATKKIKQTIFIYRCFFVIRNSRGEIK